MESDSRAADPQQRPPFQERQGHLWFLESLDEVNRAIQGTNDLDQMMQDVLDAVLHIFDCDRANLAIPCGPNESEWRVPMERTRPEYPGGFAAGGSFPITPEVRATFDAVMGGNGPVRFGPGARYPLPAIISKEYQIQSVLMTAIRPKVGEPLTFGLHQCSYPREWTTEEERLMEEIGRRLADGLTTMLMFRSLQESERKLGAALHLAHKSYDRFRMLVEHATDAFFLHEAEGIILDVNDLACEALGYSREELIGASAELFDIGMSPDDLAEMRSRLDKNELVTVQTRHRRRDGTIFPAEVRVRGFWEDGRRYAVALARDVTVQQRAQQELLESHSLLHAVVEGTSDAIFAKDLDGRYLMINSAGARFLGKTIDEVIGTHDRELFTPDSMGVVVEHDRKVLTEGILQTTEETVTAAGVTRTYLATKAPLRDADGRVTGLIGVSRDITEFKRLEEQFRQAQKMEAVGRLAGGVAHDFNNLLTVINGCSEVVLNGLPAIDRNRGLLTEIRSAGERATSLTRQLLAFSRKQVLQPKVVGLAPLLTDLCKLLRPLIGEDVELGLVIDPVLGLAKVDPSQFEQAVINLAVNARDAMPQGGRLTIETHNAELDETYAEQHPEVRPGRYVRVSVSDSGHGMDAAMKGRIFEPFFTTKEAGRGTGLGLAMVYGFVKQSGGHIDVYSEPGLGTTFNVCLPRADEKVPVDRSLIERTNVPEGHETVLLVEDETAVRTLARLVLRSCGYTVLEAHDGEEAMLVAQRHHSRIHLLLTDLVMPRMSGRELADQLLHARPTVHVLFMSGYTDEAVLRHGVLEANVAFLQKPFSPATLARKVREVLDGGAPHARA
jgi:two-component system cell cycle sensor histidine kinase/response regulator CckA